jgi:hypothetical protein
MVMVVLGGVGAIVLIFKIASWPGYLLSAIVMAGVVFAYSRLVANAKTMCSPSCAAVRSAVGYLGWEGSRHIFEIGSSAYAYGFMVANLNKLVNVTPDVWEWLRRNGHVTSPNQPQSAKRNMR